MQSDTLLGRTYLSIGAVERAPRKVVVEAETRASATVRDVQRPAMRWLVARWADGLLGYREAS